MVDQPETVATAIRIGRPVRFQEAREAVTESEGAALAVSDERDPRGVQAAARDRGRVLRAGLGGLARGAGAAREQGLVEDGARVVCILTGHGLKDPDTAVAQTVAPFAAGSGYEAVESAVLGD